MRSVRNASSNNDILLIQNPAQLPQNLLGDNTDYSQSLLAASDANYNTKSSHFTSNLEVDPLISNQGAGASAIYLSPTAVKSPEAARKSKSGQKPNTMVNAASISAQPMSIGSSATVR